MTRLAPLVLLLPQAYVTWLALGSRSRDPVVLGRYSLALFLLDAVLVAVTASFLVALRRRSYVAVGGALLGLLLLSFPVGANNQVVQAPFAVPAIVLARIGLAAGMAVFALPLRVERPGAARLLLAAGSSLLVLTLADGALLAVAARPPSVRNAGFEFRRPVDLSSVPGNGIAIVGDSFVYGSGVAEEEAFPARLAERSGGRPVYNLGQRGTGLPEYLAVLRALPPVDTAIVCFCPNDMPSRETRALKVGQVIAGARRTSAFCRLASDVVSLRELPDLDTYEKWIVGDFDRGDPTFPARWAELTRDLEAIAVEARRVSRARPPLLVVFPLLRGFSDYPLVGAHRDLDGLGASLGFEVVDMLPVFSRDFPDARRYRAAPDDSHYDARLHAEIARQIALRLPPSREPGAIRP